jgi:hypothetical protein
MKRDELSAIVWLKPWYPVEDGSRLEAELSRESPLTHPLYGQQTHAVARRTDNDDVLYYLPHGEVPLAVVHLTWSVESNPNFPRTGFYSSLHEWVEACMKVDHADFIDET